MSKERLVWADSLKGVLMLLVILGHAIQCTLGDDCESNHLWNIIYSFHMPAFMAISGWLVRKSDNFESVGYNWNWYFNDCKRRCYQLLIPFFVWTAIKYFLGGKYNLQRAGEMMLYPDRSFWFLWVLFWIYVIFKLAQLIAAKLKINEMVPILGTCLLFFGVMVVMDIRAIGFQYIAYYFLFYTIGYCLHKYEDSAFIKGLSKPFVMIALIVLWAFLAWGWTMHGLPAWVPSVPHIPSTLIQYAYRGFTALVAIVILITAAPEVLNGTGKFNKIICTFGTVSLGLYVAHLIFMGPVVTNIRTIIPSINAWHCVSLAFVIILPISCLLVWLLNKNRYTARLFLGKI